ncbi:MAG: tyrosine-type recombinase/integrase [Mailhella sp.]|nr:tyrosine-type recombinase/integrase [Mailhella sp.]
MPLFDTTLRNTRAGEKPQKLSDGGGLYLLVKTSGKKFWHMAYRFDGKQKLLSFGQYPEVSLSDAREARQKARELLAKGIDPGQVKKEAKLAKKAEEQVVRNTFQKVASEWLQKYEVKISEKHTAKLKRYLETKIFPLIGQRLVTELTPQDFLGVVSESERLGHNETAHKIMNLCSQVMRYARITGLVHYDTAGGLTAALTAVQRTHFAAITEPKEIGILLRDIDAYEGYTPVYYFLKILPYVFTRPSELRLARWEEFDFDKAMWKIPSTRMKMRREHTVPLSRQVIRLLNELKQYTGGGDLLFPSPRANSAAITDAAPMAALRRMGYTKEMMTLHGFRAMASTRLNEMNFRPDTIEAQLAHKCADEVRLAYNRADYMAERKDLVQKWADYLDELRNTK